MAGVRTDLPPVRACLFDMDGLLIDSEDLYTLVTNEILHSFGKPDLPWSIKAQLQGRPQPEAAKIFHEWAQLPISHDEYLTRVSALQAERFPTTKPLPGVETLLAKLVSTQNTSNPVHIALATSSHKRNYHLKTDHLPGLFSLFPESQRVLGDDPRIGKGRGKPLPDIYLLALETINAGLREKGEKEITPEECLVFEDAVPGVEAGRRAGMRVIWAPHPGLLEAYQGREAEVLAGLTGEHKEGEKSVAEQEANEMATERLQSAGNGKPGKLGDGLGEILPSLVDFPYERYGIKPAI
ncbi:haloacid dehalogenase superfamily protein [Aspergillus undulatus]|uniref:haloacid dehalogenase superfamily protein n=1 Tax=Aspergillus undulatus TaxID=1810928 RepID=UPI003CCD4B32